MAFCGYCGSQMPDDLKFCTNCGKPLVVTGNQTVEPDLEHEVEQKSSQSDFADLEQDPYNNWNNQVNVSANTNPNGSTDVYQAIKNNTAMSVKNKKNEFILPLVLTLIFIGIAVAAVLVIIKPFDKSDADNDFAVADYEDVTAETVEEPVIDPVNETEEVQEVQAEEGEDTDEESSSQFAPTKPDSVETSTGTLKDTDESYLNNEYYEVVEEGTYINSIGYTQIIHKILAKKDAHIDSTMLVYDSDGAVIGKSSSDIDIVEGEYNYFVYSFDGDDPDAKFQFSMNGRSATLDEKDAVEMVTYNVSGNKLFVTLKQTKDSVGGFAKFKLLLYKGDSIVDHMECYVSVYAENLNGKGTTDVASFSIYGIEFDRIEYFYEP